MALSPLEHVYHRHEHPLRYLSLSALRIKDCVACKQLAIYYRTHVRHRGLRTMVTLYLLLLRSLHCVYVVKRVACLHVLAFLACFLSLEQRPRQIILYYFCRHLLSFLSTLVDSYRDTPSQMWLLIHAHNYRLVEQRDGHDFAPLICNVW